MERRYQVFVSSTFSDLIAERQAVTQALLNLNHFPAGMELFPASNEDQWTLIKGVIDDSDYYVLIIGARYGSTTPEGISYTEKEFDYAVSAGIPILAFLHEDPDKVPSGKTDKNDAARAKLHAFRDKVKGSHHVKFWSTPENLETRVMQAVSAETKRNPREGWVRGSLSADPVRLNELTSQIDELRKALSAATTSPPSGSENYAQGNTKFTVDYRYKETEYEDEWTVSSVEMEWDEIFYELGPLLMDEATEHALHRRLSEEIHRYDSSLEFRPSDAEVEIDSFETIKIQFVALGLMSKSDKKHVPSDRNVYWQITPFGERYIMRLRAIKKCLGS